jgi:hypothetical protein
VLTAIDGWPPLFKTVGEAHYARPAILEVL